VGKHLFHHDSKTKFITKGSGTRALKGDKSLRRNFSHAGSELHGDAIVHANGAIKVSDCIPRSRMSHDGFVYDVTIDAVVRGTGIWTGARHQLEDNTYTWKHNALQRAEVQKYKKYEEGYANLSIGFLAFALSCFGLRVWSAWRQSCPVSLCIGQR